MRRPSFISARFKVEEEESAGDNAGHDAVRFMRSSRKNAALPVE